MNLKFSVFYSMSYPFVNENICRTIRNEFYNTFECRKDLSMDLLDALSAEIHANSAVKLSLSHHFTRQYSSISQLMSQIYHSRIGLPEKLLWQFQI